MKKVIIIILAVLLVIGGVTLISNKKKSNGTSTVVVKKGTVAEEIILTGQVRADKHSLLSFPTSGKISWVGVSEGQKVKKGQALISLDKTTLGATYQQAQNSYRNYQAIAGNVLDTVKGHGADESFADKATRTTAEANRDSAYDAVRSAEYNLRNATLYAPFDGTIASLPFGITGVNVSLTDTMVEIVNPTSIYFEVTADQSEVINLKDSQNVVVVLDSYQDKNLLGKVFFIGLTPISGAVGTSYKVKVTLTENQFQNSFPRIGMTGDAKFILSQKEDALYVPSKFIHSDKDGKYVNLGNKKNKTKVTVGLEGEERVEITGGIKEGDTLYD